MVQGKANHENPSLGRAGKGRETGYPALPACHKVVTLPYSTVGDYKGGL